MKQLLPIILVLATMAVAGKAQSPSSSSMTTGQSAVQPKQPNVQYQQNIQRQQNLQPTNSSAAPRPDIRPGLPQNGPQRPGQPQNQMPPQQTMPQDQAPASPKMPQMNPPDSMHQKTNPRTTNAVPQQTNPSDNSAPNRNRNGDKTTTGP